ncbi:MAG TPA: CYTH domain-containing protein [Candidatus Colwellbacteria bacterium]|nr:CYTH domain-containing protein [Candidatus Colwellbacteria bacterium]
MPQIECEIRSFIDKQKYEELIEKFKKEAEFLGERDETTYYLDVPQDLRIQRNDAYAKIWLKKGKLHDDAREEIEVRFSKEDFGKMEEMLSEIGIDPEIKWFRHRNEFLWNKIRVSVDHTKGYGYILEFERIVPAEEQEAAIADLETEMLKLGVEETPKEVFNKAFEDYKKLWPSLVEKE